MTERQDGIDGDAQEHLLRPLLGEDLAARDRAEGEEEELIQRLKGLGGEPERLVKQLRFERDTAATLREQGSVLAGLAVGLELGRL